ncbi:uncharacterized protein TNCV_3703301 [Trichonephila clavipes]|nr:uncharacterized protein TNCV_3703301 [Trichonephila clavipes]
MITNFFIPELNNHDVQELWFQQDSATCHTARATIDLLKDTFGDRLISRFGPVNWPPRSCDLTPLDYFLWGYVKSLVYADKPQTLDHLEDNIRRVIADIRPQMLEKVIENWTSRLDYIRASRGSPMPEIIFKIHIKITFDSSPFVNPTPLAHADTSRDVLPRGGTSQWHPTRFNLYEPEMRNARGFNVWPEVYFSGSEHVTESLEDIDNQIKLLEIPSDLSCAYLKGHLMNRALDWYQIFGSTLVQNTATDFAQLKAALSKAFPAIQNRKDLETRFYASQQRQNPEPTDFFYDLLKLHKKLEPGMSEKGLVDHIFVRLEPQVHDYVEVRIPQIAIQLLKY